MRAFPTGAFTDTTSLKPGLEFYQSKPDGANEGTNSEVPVFGQNADQKHVV
jgi:hypothetical protein